MIDSANTISAQFFQRFMNSAGAPDFTLDVNVVLPGQGVTAIFGPSGSGKTSLLRCVAGLLKAERGSLRVQGETWQDEKKFLPTHKRPLGYVFQEASLFPHLSAAGNLAYAMKRASHPVDKDLYERVLAVMSIEHILQRAPAELSGGERQRVAIARALLIQPRLLLMDEPLASLDTARKREILPWLERMHASFDVPVLYVSHAVEEVARLADNMLVLEAGSVVTQGKVSEVLSRIDPSFDLEEETGVLLQARVIERDERWHLARVEFEGGELWVRDGGEEPGQNLRIRILAKDVSLALAPHDDSSILNRLAVEIIEISQDKDEAMALLRLRVGKEYLLARVTRRSVEHLKLASGKKLWAQVKSVAIVR